jgi:hypothetical protein
MRRTDTFWLPFESLRYDDAGYYKLLITYLDCNDSVKSIFSDEVKVNVYGPAEIVTQTRSAFGVRGGFTSLRVDVLMPGSAPNRPIEYQ